MRNLVVGVQIVTMLLLAVMFWRSGDARLALAQSCYGIATVFLFVR